MDRFVEITGRIGCNAIADIIALTIGNVQLYEQAVVARLGWETAHRGQMNFAGILFRFSFSFPLPLSLPLSESSAHNPRPSSLLLFPARKTKTGERLRSISSAKAVLLNCSPDLNLFRVNSAALVNCFAFTELIRKMR